MIKRMALALVLVLALALPASAEVNGVYAGLKFIDSIQSTGTVSNDNLNGLGISDHSQNTVGGGIFVGYDFYPAHQVPVRAEIEYSIRSNMNTTWDTNNVYGVPGLNSEFEAKWNLQTLFFNLYYDFHNSTNFTPYIGAGAGIGFINSNYDASLNVTNVGGVGIASVSKMNSVFAWNVGLGCSYAFNENFSADLAYRFVGLGRNETSETVLGQEVQLTTSPYANEISLGLRFTF
jgi:opacity protein-like surface antigen